MWLCVRNAVKPPLSIRTVAARHSLLEFYYSLNQWTFHMHFTWEFLLTAKLKQKQKPGNPMSSCDEDISRRWEIRLVKKPKPNWGSRAVWEVLSGDNYIATFSSNPRGSLADDTFCFGSPIFVIECLLFSRKRPIKIQRRYSIGYTW